MADVDLKVGGFDTPEKLEKFIVNACTIAETKRDGIVWIAVPEGKRKEVITFMRAVMRQLGYPNSLEQKLKVVQKETYV